MPDIAAQERESQLRKMERTVMENIRAGFATQFGESQAEAIEAAARYHGNGFNNKEIGDPFKWALLICISYQCFEIERYRKAHKITAAFDEIRKWIKDNAELHTYRGDLDYLALFCGAYNEYMPTTDDPAAKIDALFASQNRDSIRTDHQACKEGK